MKNLAHEMPKARLNEDIAFRFTEYAELLEQQAANPFRINAYRKAATSLRALDQDVSQLFEREGKKGLIALRYIGEGIANSIIELITSGRWSKLNRLRHGLDPEHVFCSVPGIGPELAHRITEELHIDSLERLEAAAHSGELEKIPGIGPRRTRAIAAALGSMLNRLNGKRTVRGTKMPTVAEILNIDREYRAKAKAKKLPTIAPRRFNPEGSAWLPVLHTSQGPWQFTALFSNTARAHELRTTKDWVIIYCYDHDHIERQCTVVTETRGILLGKRVVRGREEECREHYATQA